MIAFVTTELASVMLMLHKIDTQLYEAERYPLSSTIASSEQPIKGGSLGHDHAQQ